jgi:hypothetical protein
MMRWQDVVLGALLIPRIAEELQDAPRAKWFRVAAQLGVPVVLLMVPQMFFWNRIYGTPLLVPPGPDFAPWWRPAALPMLFSTWNGAFVWSPLLLVGLLGLRHLDDRRLRWGALAGILLHIYVCALLLDWWGGRSFGCRRMISLAPLAAWGLALLLAKLAVRRTALAAAMFGVALACAWNLQLAVCQRYGVMPWNVGNSADYVRHHDPSSASARPYRKFDYPRLVREFRAAQPWLDSARSAR